MIDTIKQPVGRSLQAEASSAHSRINIPLNLENWRHLDEETVNELMWFHQHCLDEKLSWEDAREALGGVNADVFAVLKGNFSGDYAEVVKAITTFKAVTSERAGIIKGEFAPNAISEMIWAGLDYAAANNSITQITGESGHGKSIASRAWKEAHNHGRTVMVEASPVGGTRGFLGILCEAIGANKNMRIDQQRDAILRAFNPNRVLIVDEAHRLIPRDTRINPEKVDFLRYLHDRTGCALALIATARLDDEMQKSSYLFEQVLGRIGMPIRLPRLLVENAYRPLVVQYFPRPTAKLLQACAQLANDQMPKQKGRLRLLNQVLRLATRIASKARKPLTEAHFFSSLALRQQMMGDTFAKDI
ncbi:MAG TPA: ATP-binding protein [Rariglobus sp.]|jgi:DNA transposition AAA+ family ATPase|nr:ATP-binding protein [Rariglobus sp.]